ncbi:HTH_Tnp_Tc3_2 domain-containing protein [Trichonephila clavipes]|nr:HTH_Tnp_Tc3_2 domain-containing protein [Trichonephila clavipes]
MPLRSHYQQLTQFERGRVIELREGGFSFSDIAETLGRNVSTVRDCWEQWSRDGAASRRPSFEVSRGTTEKEDHRIRCRVVAPRTASPA